MDNLSLTEINTMDNSIITDKCYDKFKQSILQKDRPLLFGKFVYIPINWNQGKVEMFWHISSLSPKEELEIYPCNNDPSYSLCNGNCINEKCKLKFSNKEVRIICYYRMIRAHWIRQIIDWANVGDSRIYVWEKKQKDNNTNLYVRYIFNEIDYLLVFAIRSNKYVLLSAYPVFYIRSKQSHTQDYQNYIKKSR